MESCREDARAILADFKSHEKQLQLKRKWLLGIPTTKSEKKKLKKIFKNMYLPESLLREDDIFYESVRTHVERAFGAQQIERESQIPQDDMELIQIPNMKRLTLSCLDSLTTKGLYHLANIVTGGSLNSVVTRGNLKKIIKNSLSGVLSSKGHSHHQLETRKQIFQLLTNPQHFRDKYQPLPALRSQSYHAAVTKVLHELQELPTQTLIAMRRKLKGVKATTPQLLPHKHGWARDHLIKLVKKISREMLSQLDNGNELQEPLAKAMAVADLSLKVTTGCHNLFSREFHQFSPEVKSLQSDILNAIWSVKKKKAVTVAELRDLQRLIEPKAVISNRRLRTAFVNFLTEFLFECSDMDKIPESLMQVLDVVNKGSNSGMHNVSLQKKYIEEEADCILNLSAQMKQVVLDLLPDSEFDQDFTDAYMEPLEESDDGSSDEDFMDSDYEAESVGDFAPFELHPSTTMTEENVASCPFTTSERLNSGSIIDESVPTKNSECKNQYLAIQDACDKTSLLAHNLIGHMLKQFAVIEGLDLDSSKSLYLTGGDNQIEDEEETKEPSSSRKHMECSAIVEEQILSLPDRIATVSPDSVICTNDINDMIGAGKIADLALHLVHGSYDFEMTKKRKHKEGKSKVLEAEKQKDEKLLRKRCREERKEKKKGKRQAEEENSENKETKEPSSSRKHMECSAIVEEQIISLPDRIATVSPDSVICTHDINDMIGAGKIADLALHLVHGSYDFEMTKKRKDKEGKSKVLEAEKPKDEKLLRKRRKEERKEKKKGKRQAEEENSENRETKEPSSSRKHMECSAIVEERIPSLSDRIAKVSPDSVICSNDINDMIGAGKIADLALHLVHGSYDFEMTKKQKHKKGKSKVLEAEKPKDEKLLRKRRREERKEKKKGKRQAEEENSENRGLSL